MASRFAKSASDDFFVASPRTPWYGSLCLFKKPPIRIRFVAIDEGIGTYVPSKLWRQAQSLELGKTTSASQEVASRIARIIRVDNRFLFSVENGELIVNRQLANAYRHALEFSARSASTTFADHASAWFLTSPFSENGYMSLEDELRLVRSCLDRLMKAGYTVYLKPHPTESSLKYAQFDLGEGLILDKDPPIESFIIGHPPTDIVVGFASTALLNVKAIFDIDTYLISPQAQDMHPYASKSHTTFCRLSRCLVKSFDEIAAA